MTESEAEGAECRCRNVGGVPCTAAPPPGGSVCLTATLSVAQRKSPTRQIPGCVCAGTSPAGHNEHRLVGWLVDRLGAAGMETSLRRSDSTEGETSEREGRFRINRVCLQPGITGKKTKRTMLDFKR